MVSKSEPIRWGILGTGFIAREFASGLRSLPDARLAAIGSRDLESARQFSRQFNVPKAYGTYAELLEDQALDVVYIATPHTSHNSHCLAALKAGKAVLCEKPFTVNGREAKEIITAARQYKLFCMEAMWMRFMPLIGKVKELIDNGQIGELRLFTADFGYPVQFDPQSRFFNPELGGGALLDRGVYPLSLAFFLFGAPDQITGRAYMGESGVDEQSGMILTYPNGALGFLSSTFNTYASNSAVITGTQGKIIIHEPFYQPDKISLVKFPKTAFVPNKDPSFGSSGLKQKLVSNLKRNALVKTLVSKLRYPSTTFSHANEGNGLNYEAAEVGRCLRSGETESRIMPLEESLRIMETMDMLRQQWHLQYPQDKEN